MNTWFRYLASLVYFINLCVICSAVTTVFIEECKAGKYFWKEKLPTEFYACLSLPRRAVKLRCPPGSYMCNTGPQFFQPCMCKGKSLKYYKQYGISEKLYETKYLENVGTSDTQQQGNEIDSSDMNFMMSTESTIAGNPEGKEGFDPSNPGPVEPSLPANGCPAEFRQVDNAHMYFGVKYEGSLVECQHACIGQPECLGVDWNKKEVQCYLLSLQEKGTIRFGLNYNAYTIHYRRTYCVSTVAQGLFLTTPAMQSAGNGGTSLPETTTGIPVSGGSQGSSSSTGSSGSSSGSSVGLSSGSASGSSSSGSSGTSNTGSMVVTGNPLPQVININGFNGNGQLVTPGAAGVMAATTSGPPVVTAAAGSNSVGGAVGTSSNSVGSAANAAAGSTGFGIGTGGFNPPNVTPSPAAFSASTTTIPDSGCPYSVEKFEDTSHPFGINITFSVQFDDPEKCKYWCLINSFCAGVDFDKSTGTCYYLREIDESLVTSVPGVTHYRITKCQPPLKCWSQDTIVDSDGDLSIIDETHPQTACMGVCFVSQTLGASFTTVQRGCLPITDSPALKPPNGCSVDSTYKTIVCFCDTPRCNGLSINALASQLLYMPLDGDLSDRSGIVGRSGDTPPGYTTPNFQCLDKAVNCAALFTGNECISVSSLARTKWGSDESDTKQFDPTASFVVWFKRVSNGGLPMKRGIFGNSIDTHEPSWQIMTEAINNFIQAGVSSEENPGLRDYPYIKASNDEWHLAVLTYDGRHNVTAMQFPSLTLYIDCVPVMGNSKADQGAVGVRNQPVSIGCVQGQNFVGFIDEARIFSSVLTIDDIRALKAMQDPNYFW